MGEWLLIVTGIVTIAQS